MSIEDKVKREESVYQYLNAEFGKMHPGTICADIQLALAHNRVGRGNKSEEFLEELAVNACLYHGTDHYLTKFIELHLAYYSNPL